MDSPSNSTQAIKLCPPSEPSPELNRPHPQYHSHYCIWFESYKQVDYYFKPSDSDVLCCPFHGSIKSGITPIPAFRLYNLNIPSSPNLLSIADSLLKIYRQDGLEIGWYLDTLKVKQQSLIEELIRYYAHKTRSKHIVFYASSAGGFTSVLMAAKLRATAIISNAQLFLQEYEYFERLQKVLHKNNDYLKDYDLLKSLQGTQGPKQIINYCNKDDYTYSHHMRVLEFVHRHFPNTQIINHYFSGNSRAQARGIANHGINFPDAKQTASSIIDAYISSLAPTQCLNN